MKKLLTGLMVLLGASTASAANGDVAHWNSIVGVITAQNVDNPIAHFANNVPVGTVIHSGTFAWSARSGHASVNLRTGHTSFSVMGLSINGTEFSGTPGPISEVTGTLVCNLGEATEAILDTPDLPLGAGGNVTFTGSIGPIPATCANPLFLIRIAVPAGAAGRWIATGTGLANGND